MRTWKQEIAQRMGGSGWSESNYMIFRSKEEAAEGGYDQHEAPTCGGRETWLKTDDVRTVRKVTVTVVEERAFVVNYSELNLRKK